MPDLPAAGSYTVVPEASLVLAIVRRDPDALGNRLSHDHAIRASVLSGSISWDPTSDCKLEFRAPVEGFVVDEPAARTRAGLEGELTEGDRETITEHMRAEDQLHSSRFPDVVLRSTSCELAEGGDEVAIAGTLGIRGVSHDVAITGTVQPTDPPDTFQVSGRLEILQTDFGFSPYSALFGALRNADPVEISFDIVLRRQ